MDFDVYKISEKDVFFLKYSIIQNEVESADPYIFKLRTGCKNEPKRGKKFCESCKKKYCGEDVTTGKLLFLESIHPLGNKSAGRVAGKQVDSS